MMADAPGRLQPQQQDGTKQQPQQRTNVPNLAIATAKDYVPGQETELLESVQKLLFSSMGVLNQDIATKAQTQASTASDWFWKQAANVTGQTTIRSSSRSSGEEKKCDDMDIRSNKSGDWAPGEMDGIMDSMGYVLEVMGKYQDKAHKAAKEFMDEHEQYQKKEAEADKLSKKVAEVNTKSEASDPNTSAWNLREVAKELSKADFILGSLMPSHSADEYPEGSEPLFPMSSSNPATDAFMQSFSSFVGMPSQNGETHNQMDNGNLLTMESKLQYLNDVHNVSKACERQIEELDSILSMGSMQSTGAANHNNVVTKDVAEEQAAKPQLQTEAAEYIQEARDKLAEYGALAESLLEDQVKCLITEYTTSADSKCAGTAATSKSDEDTAHFERLRTHFNGDAYNMDFKAYLIAASDGQMKKMLLNIIHSSVFLRNVGDKCQAEIRVHVGKELSVTICNILMSSLIETSHEQEHRITEWGARLFSRHVRALHAYVYEFCRYSSPISGKTEEILKKVESSSLDAPPMDANWQRLFSALDILKVKHLSKYDQATMLHPLHTPEDARRILSLRTDFEDKAIEKALLATAAKTTKKERLGKSATKKKKKTNNASNEKKTKKASK